MPYETLLSCVPHTVTRTSRGTSLADDLLRSSQGLIIMRREFSTSRLDCLLTGVHVQPLPRGLTYE